MDTAKRTDLDRMPVSAEETIRYRWIHSLRNRLIVILLLSSIIPIVLIGTTSYYYIHSLQENKVRNAIQNNLMKVATALENNLSNLNHVSQQLALSGKVGKNIYDYMTNENLLDRRTAANNVNEEINFIGSTNPNVSLMMYYNAPTNQYIFQNYPARVKTSLKDLPVLATTKGMTYYGPHKTLNSASSGFVLSVSRKVNVYDIGDNFIYIESNSSVIEDALNDDNFMDMNYLIVNEEGMIAYSENEAKFPIGSDYRHQKTIKLEESNYYAFQEGSKLGWTVVSLIPVKTFERESRSWFSKIMLFSALSLGISLLFVWIIWRTVYRPLTRISKAILSIDDHQFIQPKRTRLIEFDLLIDQFKYLKHRIIHLMEEIKQKEKNKARLEVEKLLLQINPHFIHNTLDTIRWIARINGQETIDKLVSTLNRLLYYNMGKGETATIKDEVTALNDYVELQGIRYNFQFNVEVNADESVMGIHIPRFILQPLVENALYHGGSDNGLISVQIGWQSADLLSIQVTDTGVGITDESIRALLDQSGGERKKAGMGIGVQYVLRMIQFQYGEEAQLLIESNKGSGTTITLLLPMNEKEDERHERADR
ncbi:sensor histidine kinase [Paenibacillus spongiae]|uniref:histidine kinase n=1 Tax=Paenibacillus spongiae TaxID=2909671 RepID=A0ABY5SDT9_9BACL|nr:histidine kinase [Paenibacillus spongiae]UVI31703.1 histidine kinase [Paenibacillus spongiae]